MERISSPPAAVPGITSATGNENPPNSAKMSSKGSHIGLLDKLCLARPGKSNFTTLT